MSSVTSDKLTAEPGIQSVEIGMEVLSTLARQSTPQSLSAMAVACGMSRTKVYRYLSSLVRTGFVERELGTGYYRLSGGSVQLGVAALANVDFIRIASELLASICDDLQECVILTIWSDRGPVIVRWEEPARQIAMNLKLGSTMPLLNSATGHVFGAYMPPEATDFIVREELKNKRNTKLGAKTGVETFAQARTLFADVAKKGFGQAEGSMLYSIHAFARPVFEFDGGLAGTISSLGLEGDFDISPDGPTATKLAGWAEQISGRLGYRAD
ncbi:MAG: IclR family transcriptional regulator [Marinosulfonomonas sp.]|nr:IclR family transcriptional regulator [Marinosulfonomonas sp.]